MLGDVLSLLLSPTLLVAALWLYEQVRQDGVRVMPIEWGAINTGLMLALGGYVWRQMRRVDTIYQALFGVDGRNGLLRRIEKLETTAEALPKMLQDGRHGLRNEMQQAISELHEEFIERLRERK